MFKKFKSELKAAFKIGKSSKLKDDNKQLLTVDGSGDDKQGPAGLSRPHGLRGSLDIARPAGVAGADSRPGCVGHSGVASREARGMSNNHALVHKNADINSSSPTALQHGEQPKQQQQHHHHRQHGQHSQPQLQAQADAVASPAASPRAAGGASSGQAGPEPSYSAAISAQSSAGGANSSTAEKHHSGGRAGRYSEARAAAAAEAVARAETAAASRGPEPSRTPRDEDLGGCPPYATKAVWGLRYTMEDKWAAVPNLIQLPCVLTQPQKKAGNGGVKASGCGCMLKPSKVLAKSLDKSQDHVPLIAHHGSDELPESPAASSSSAAVLELDSLHYFGVFDGHGGADAARHCAQRMHQVVCDTIQGMLNPEAAAAATAAAQPDSSSTHSNQAAADPQQQQQQQIPVGEQELQQQQQHAAAPAAEGTTGQQQPGPAAHERQQAWQNGGSIIVTAESVPAASLSTLASSNGNWLLLALSKAFVFLDTEFGVLSEGSYVGSTAVVVLLGTNRLWVAHAGDSRAVLGRKGVAMVLTSDHKASRDDEVQRVQAAGGHVWWDRVMGELAVSRAIGDHCLRPYVIPEPEVMMLDRTKDDEVLVMASDGLWDVIGNQEAADMAVHSLQAAEASGHQGVAAAKRAATSLTKAALERGTRDNVTVLVVDLRTRASASSSSNASFHSATGDEKPRPEAKRSHSRKHGQHAQHHSPAAAAAAAGSEGGNAASTTKAVDAE